ncbi:MAG: HTH domain-containing protein, partial [Proteobacteria bacterium]|nr:HTH domain-containing protein [Pseudomonadota bacterium]
MSTKDELLSHLKEAKDAWTSGEILAADLTISRNAVRKQIRFLKDEGYLIDASPRKGYLLRKAPDLLLPAEIRDGLKTALLGRERIDYFAVIDSTNVRARMIADEGAPEGTVVVAETQLKGKGRRGRSWFSPAGQGIYVSAILRPTIPPAEAPR